MADPLGIIGLTGTVEQLVRLTKVLIDSHKALQTNTPAAKRLLTTYEQLESMLTGISTASFQGAKSSHVKTVKHELDTVMGIFTKAREEVESKTTESGKWASQYLSALKEKARIGELEADAEKIRECIFKLSSDENLNWRLNKMSESTEETCCPLIWAEKNPTSVFIDLNAKDEKGRASSCESKLKEAVLAEGRETHVGAIAIGQGGVGKTCTLLAIANDADTAERFPGGVYFLPLGSDATTGTIIQQLSLAVKASGGEKLAARLQTDDNVRSVVAAVQVWFRKQASLFIFDDVWTRNGIDVKVLHNLSGLVNELPKEGSKRSRILYSTRDVGLETIGEAVRFKERERRGDRALEILLKVAGEEGSARDDGECQRHILRILDKCAGLPLALNVAGSAVRMLRKRWEGDARGAWKKYSEMMDEPNRFERRGGDGGYWSLYGMLESSIKILDDRSSSEEIGKFAMTFQEMHRSLCVLKRQDWLPLSIVQHLWGTSDESTTERGMELLESVGAGELQYRDGMGGVRLHDLTQDFARYEAKKHDEEKKWHRKLLDKYRTSEGSMAHTVLCCVNEKEKRYAFENIYRVCQEAGEWEETYEILQSARWVSSVLESGTLWVFERAVKDIAEGVPHGMGSSSEGVVEESRRLDEDCKFGLRKIAKAARLCVSYLNGNASNLFFQLYARLVEESDESAVVRRFLEDVERWAPKPWVKAVRGCFADSDGLVEDIHVGFISDKVKFSSDGITGCACMGEFPHVVWTFKQNRVKGVDVMRWDVDGAYDGLLTREVEDIWAPTAGADSTTGRAEVTEREGARAVEDGNLRSAKRVLDRLRATTKCRWWCFRSKDEQRPLQEQLSTVICSDVWEDLVATGCSNGRIFIGRLSTNKIDLIIRGHAKAVSSICFSENGRQVVSGSLDKTVRVWDVATGAPACETLNGHTNMVSSVAVSGDERRVVSGSGDKTVRVWDVATGAPACEPLTGHTNWVWSVAISGDGRRVVSGSWDKTVRVWDVGTGAPACEALTGHTNLVSSVAISGDGRRVVSGSDDKTVCLWEGATGQCLLVTSWAQWDETVARYCGSVPEHVNATTSEEECEHFYVESGAIKVQWGNGEQEVLAQLQLYEMGMENAMNSRMGVVVTGQRNGRVGIFRIIK